MSEDNIVDLEAQRAKRRKVRVSLTEDSLAYQLVTEHGDSMRYDHQRESWFTWDGARWAIDRTGRVTALIRNMVRDYGARSSQRTEDKLCGRRTISNIEWLARSDARVARVSTDFDRHDLVLGTPAGAVNLKTGELLRRWVADPAVAGGGGWVQRSKQALITRSTAIAPAEAGEEPTLWLQFLREALRGDEEMLRFVQVMLGYCLTGSIKEHALFFLYGPGGNGKSVFVDTIVNIMGEYAAVAMMETFTATEAHRHTAELAMLDGARLVVASETEQGRSWAESRVKQLTGGDPITAQWMRQNPFTFRPKFKLILSGNHKPGIKSIDDAMRRRLRLLAWLHRPARPDDALLERLRGEYPAILRWMVQGARAWVWGGLPRSAAVVSSTEDYLADQDTLGDWIAAELITDEFPIHPQTMLRERLRPLFKSWRAYCENGKLASRSEMWLSEQLKSRGYFKKRENRGVIFSGLSLKNGGGEGPLFDGREV